MRPSSTNERNGKVSCIIHCRVSTSKQAYEGESLDVQEAICRNIASERHWEIAHTPWKEAFSSRKKIRPVFQEILAFLDKNPGVAQKYVFRSIDRFTRLGSLTYGKMKHELAKRGVEMVDSYGIIQPVRNTLEDVGFEYEWSQHSPSEMTETVLAIATQNELTSILTRLIGQEIRLAQRGYKVRQAQDGFKNVKIQINGKKLTLMEPDPDRAHYFITMFEMRASGKYTDRQICDHINALGYRRRSQNRWDSERQEVIGKREGGILHPQKLQEIVRRPDYCGVSYEKWTHWKPIRAQNEGLVSIDLFNAANKGKVFIREDEAGELTIEYDGRPKAKLNKRNPLFPYKNVILCQHCRRPFYGSSPRGKDGRQYPTYHCSRNHKYFGIRKSVFEKTVTDYVMRLKFQSDRMERLHAQILDRYHEEEGRHLDRAKQLQQNKAELEIKLTETVRAFRHATTDTVRRSLEAEAEDLDRQIKGTQAIQNTMEVTGDDIAGFIREIKTVLEHPGFLLKDPESTPRQVALYSLVFQTLPTYEKLVFGTAELSPIFYVFSDSETSKSRLVRQQGLTWKQIEAMILAWKHDKHLLPCSELPPETLGGHPEERPQSP